MLGSLMMLAAAAALPLQSPPDPPPCRLKVGVAIACGGDVESGPQNAADSWNAYGLKKAEITKDYAKDYLNSFGCTRFFDATGPLKMKTIQTVRVATQSGYVVVRYIDVRAGTNSGQYWLADGYFAGPCPHY